jgi:hypothetical protein
MNKLKTWRIDGTVDNTVHPDADPILFSLNAKGATIEEAVDSIDSELHAMAAKRGWKRGDYDIHTNETEEPPEGK